ncbi:MAG: hypothetical protein Q7S89_01045 [bacterium]|nr:hypothetical protein [bacterium]
MWENLVATVERCKHGTLALFCAFCQPPSEPPKDRRPVVRQDKTVFGVAALDADELERSGYVVIHTCKAEERDHHSFRDLGPETLFVHINGQPLLWAIEKILALAPNLKTIQVIPTMLRKFHPDSHLRLCRERGVEVRAGHHRPEMAWEPGRIASPFYDHQQRFFEGLEGEQRALFDELLAMNFDAAVIVAQYFCLKGEKYVPQRILAEEYGFGNDERQVSMRINAIIIYLDPTFETGDRSKQFAEELKRRVERLRPLLESADMRRRLADELAIPKLPEKFPLSRLQVFREIVKARRDGRLDESMSVHQHSHRALKLRFGLEREVPTTYRRLREVAEILGVTRQRAFQLEEEALKILGIKDEA